MTYVKDPDAVLDYAIDWTDLLVDGEAITSDQWDITPVENNGLALGATASEGPLRSAFVSGGRRGRIYRLRNRVLTSAGRSDDRSILIRISEQ